MVEPLLILGGAAALLTLLKPKEMTPAEAQEKLDKIPQEDLEKLVPQDVSVTPAPTAVDPAPPPKTCVLVKKPPPPPVPPQIVEYRRKEKELKLKLSAELKAEETKFSEALKGFSYRDARTLVYPTPSIVVSRWGGKSVPQHQAEMQAKNLGLTIDEIKVALKATEGAIIKAKARMGAKKREIYQEVLPFLDAWDRKRQMASFAAGTEFQARLRKYRRRGWSIHQVKIRMTQGLPSGGAQMGAASFLEARKHMEKEKMTIQRVPGNFRSVVYACPPGVAAPVFE